MTRNNVIMASAPTSSAARSQAWISTVRFTTESQPIGPGAAPLGRSRGRRPARWELWWCSHRGLCGGGDVGGPATLDTLPPSPGLRPDSALHSARSGALIDLDGAVRKAPHIRHDAEEET